MSSRVKVDPVSEKPRASVPTTTKVTPLPTKWNMGLSYGSGAVLLLGLAIWRAPESLILGWPGVSLGMVAAGYLGLGPGVFAKTSGRIAPAARLLLAPYLLALWLRRLTEWRRGSTHDEILPGLHLGRTVRRDEAPALIKGGISVVLDLTCEHNETRALRDLDYCNVQLLDLILPSLEQIREAVSFVLNRMENGPVYVHCALGQGRSAIVTTACVLAMDRNFSVEHACDIVKAARPSVKLRPRERALLEKYRSELSG